MKSWRHMLAIIACLLAVIARTAQGQPSTMKMASDYCSDFTATGIYGYDRTGCWVDITVKQIWTAYAGSCALQFPYGIEVAAQAGDAITSVTNRSGAWIASGSTVMSLVPAKVRFTRAPIANPASTPDPWCPANAANVTTRALTTNQSQSFRVYLSHAGNGPITLNVYELNGNFALTPPSPDRQCVKQIVVQPPQALPYQATAAPANICSGGVSAITLQPTPPSGTITWYWYEPTATNPGCPTTAPPAAPWTLGTTFGGTTYLTNRLYATRCYAAVVSIGCFSYVSTIARVSVCPAPGSIGIGTSPNIPIHPWDNQRHVCSGFLGNASLSGIDPNLCNARITWTLNNAAMPGTKGSTQVALNLQGPTTPGTCSKQYVVAATVAYDCGGTPMTTTRSTTIIVDAPNAATATVSASPVPILCHEQGTVLKAVPTCGNVTSWEKSTAGPGGPWSAIPGATNTVTWWTNNLTQTTWYRPMVTNFSCPPKPGNTILINVKPPLGVSIATNKICLGAPNPVLTASLASGYPPAGVTYQWFRDGMPIAGGTGPSHVATQAGFYWAEARDPACWITTVSNGIDICRIGVAIAAPGCSCVNTPIALAAVPAGSCTGGCTYTWTSTSGFMANGQSVVDPHPNFGPGGAITYTVTMSCGTGCVTQAKWTVRRCP